MINFLAFIGAYALVALGIYYSFTSYLTSHNILMTVLVGSDTLKLQWLQIYNSRLLYSGFWIITAPITVFFLVGHFAKKLLTRKSK